MMGDREVLAKSLFWCDIYFAKRKKQCLKDTCHLSHHKSLVRVPYIEKGSVASRASGNIASYFFVLSCKGSRHVELTREIL